MVLLRLSSAQVQLTESVIEIDDGVQISNLKNFIVGLFPTGYDPLEDVNNNIKLIYFGRVIGNDEILKDVLKVRAAPDASHIYTLHFSISQTEPLLQQHQPATPSSIQNNDELLAELNPQEEIQPAPQHSFNSEPANDVAEPTRDVLPYVYAAGSGRTYVHGTASYDTFQSSTGGTSYLVDQLENSSVVYEVTVTGADGVEKTVRIPSSQCIINDTGDHQPYILLTRSAVSALRHTLGTTMTEFQVNIVEPTANTDYRGYNQHFRNSRINRWYNWRRPLRNANNLFDGIRVFGYNFHNISWRELPFYLYDRILTSLENFVAATVVLGRTGGLTRFFKVMLGILKFPVILIIFASQYDIEKNHPYIYYGLMLVTTIMAFLDNGNVNNLRELLTHDLSHMTGTQTILECLQMIKDFKVQLLEFSNNLTSNIVLFLIGNNRRGLIINDYGHLYEGRISGLVSPRHNGNWLLRNFIIFVQDVMCFILTLIPQFYMVFNQEMIRRVAKVEQEATERAEEAAAAIEAQSEADITTEVNNNDDDDE